MSGVTYSIKCPSCSAEAVAHMRALGTTGTYREPRVKLGVGRITCGACGFNREVPAEEAGAYELWYATEFKGHRLWACNREHLAFLTAWFSGAINKADLDAGDRAMVEAFPKWMIMAKHRDALLKALNLMAVKSACNSNHA